MNEATRKTIIKAAEALCDHLMNGDHGPAYDVARSILTLLDYTPEELAKPCADDMTEDRRRRLAEQVAYLRNLNAKRKPTAG